jgi:hypothetical protein
VVLVYGKAGRREEGEPTPGWIAQVDLFWSVEGVVPAEEERAEVVRACAGDGLHAVEHDEGHERRDLVGFADLTARPWCTAGD